MGKSLRSHVKKAHKTVLRTRLHAPQEQQRAERLHSRLIEQVGAADNVGVEVIAKGSKASADSAESVADKSEYAPPVPHPAAPKPPGNSTRSSYFSIVLGAPAEAAKVSQRERGLASVGMEYFGAEAEDVTVDEVSGDMTMAFDGGDDDSDDNDAPSPEIFDKLIQALGICGGTIAVQPGGLLLLSPLGMFGNHGNEPCSIQEDCVGTMTAESDDSGDGQSGDSSNDETGDPRLVVENIGLYHPDVTQPKDRAGRLLGDS